ncbi:hypothetical protein KKA15_00170 [Patescibacteria group bacterium]|nr:hypothetical protein [Patescibacteria group bacterium]
MTRNLIKKQAFNYKQIDIYLKKAKEGIDNSEKILKISEEEAFKATYDAMLKITLALMLLYSVRPKSRPGHHKAMIEFTEKTLGKENKNIIVRFDKMRQRRNKIIYEISIINYQEAKEAAILAKQYHLLVKKIVEKKNPQKKLI